MTPSVLKRAITATCVTFLIATASNAEDAKPKSDWSALFGSGSTPSAKDYPGLDGKNSAKDAAKIGDEPFTGQDSVTKGGKISLEISGQVNKALMFTK